MRVAALYDIHGNLPAVAAVLADIERLGVDCILVGGDVFPGPLVRETLALLESRRIPCRFLRGNGENDVLAARAGRPIARVPEAYRAPILWHAAGLSDAEAATVAGWAATTPMHVPGLGGVLFCHATPRDDNELFTRLTPAERLLPAFAASDAELIVCGHTHMQFDRRVGQVRVVNAGSVGMPFGTPGADWLLLGPEVELRHTDYDREAAAALFRASSYPQAEFVTTAILQPAPADAMTELFERAAMR